MLLSIIFMLLFFHIINEQHHWNKLVITNGLELKVSSSLNFFSLAAPNPRQSKNESSDYSADEDWADHRVLWFGPHQIPPETVFYQTELSFAFVNLKPVLPGHVLVSPVRRDAQRLIQLTDRETVDLFIVARMVQTALEKHFDVRSTTVLVQDGPDAGQTINHVHVHVVPRSARDFEGGVDKFYEAMQLHEKAQIKARSLEEMRAEATIYRALMKKHK